MAACWANACLAFGALLDGSSRAQREARRKTDDISRLHFHKPPRTAAKQQTCRETAILWAFVPYTTTIDLRRTTVGDIQPPGPLTSPHCHYHGGISGGHVSRRCVQSKRRASSTSCKHRLRNRARCFDVDTELTRANHLVCFGRASQHPLLGVLHITHVALHSLLYYPDLHNEFQLFVGLFEQVVDVCGANKPQGACSSFPRVNYDLLCKVPLLDYVRQVTT